MLQFCVSQQANDLPFAFKATGIKVYSFEEVLYHVFHYWRESVDEFLSDEMILWVGRLGLTYFAGRMKELALQEPFTKRMLDFLRLADYFDREELEGLRSSLEAWEMRREWEKLKERGDYFTSKGEPAKAIPLYKRALQYDENAALLNNIAVAYMQLGENRDGLSTLTKALTIDPESHDILLHYIEAAILSDNFDKAAKALKKAHSMRPECTDIAFLVGLMSYQQKDYHNALTYFGKAMESDSTVPHYVYKTVDVHLTLRQYEKALETLRQIATPDAAYHTKEAQLYAAWGDIPQAIKSMNRAIQFVTKEPEIAYEGAAYSEAFLCTKLAGYYRQDYNFGKAEEAIQKAIAADPENDLARLEYAKIKKGLGRTREYQAVLNDILKSFKERYRQPG